MGALDLTLATGHVVVAEQLIVRTSPSGGPGGQHANRTHSRVEVRVHIRDLQLDAAMERQLRSTLASRIHGDDTVGVVCSRTRSQHTNRQAAVARLGQLIDAATRRERHRIPTKMSHGAQLRQRASKQQRGERKRSRGWRWDGSE